jgi:hypothetical protein
MTQAIPNRYAGQAIPRLRRCGRLENHCRLLMMRANEPLLEFAAKFG